jgi:hypothetical protein
MPKVNLKVVPYDIFPFVRGTNWSESDMAAIKTIIYNELLCYVAERNLGSSLTSSQYRRLCKGEFYNYYLGNMSLCNEVKDIIYVSWDAGDGKKGLYFLSKAFIAGVTVKFLSKEFKIKGTKAVKDYFNNVVSDGYEAVQSQSVCEMCDFYNNGNCPDFKDCMLPFYDILKGGSDA